MNQRSRSTVGIYARPHPLRTRKAWVSAAVAIVVAAGYALWFYLR